MLISYDCTDIIIISNDNTEKGVALIDCYINPYNKSEDQAIISSTGC